MAASAVTVCNMALARLGGRAITSLEEGSREAVLSNTFYEPSRDAVLRDHFWRFAGRQRRLGLLEGDTVGWGFAYAYPSDCLAVRHIQKPLAQTEPVPFEVSSNGDGVRVILSDMESAVLVYTARIADLGACDPLFLDALAWKMAAELALPLTQDKALARMARESYHMVLSQARTVDANEGQEKPAPVASWLAGRGV